MFLNLAQLQHLNRLFDGFFITLRKESKDLSHNRDLICALFLDETQYHQFVRDNNLSGNLMIALNTAKHNMQDASDLLQDLKLLGPILDDVKASTMVSGLFLRRITKELFDITESLTRELNSLYEENNFLKQKVRDLQNNQQFKQQNLNKKIAWLSKEKERLESICNAQGEKIRVLSKKIIKDAKSASHPKISEGMVSVKRPPSLSFSQTFFNNVEKIDEINVDKKYPLLPLKNKEKENLAFFYKEIDRISKSAQLQVSLNYNPKFHDYFDFIGNSYRHLGNLLSSILNVNEVEFPDGSFVQLNSLSDFEKIIEKIADLNSKQIMRLKGCNIQHMKDLMCFDEMSKLMHEFVQSIKQINEEELDNHNKLT